jgi:hypothetical protein
VLTFSQKKVQLPVPRFSYICVCIVLLAIIVCAHKAPPLSKDRLSPRLQKVNSLNNRQVQFIFSEKIDTLSLQPGNFTIVSDGDTLKILVLYASLSPSEIVAVTEMQSPVVYDASGYIFDEAGNKGAFTRTFTGSTIKDTIAPWVIDYSEGYNQNNFYVTFSEAMDTSFVQFLVVPKKNLIPVWRDYRTCQFLPQTSSDSLHYDTTYYLYTKHGMRDISGNFLNLFITSVSPDTLYEPLILTGIVMVNDTLVQSGVAVMSRTITMGIAEVKDGEVHFEVRDSLPYRIDVLSGPYSGSADVSVRTQDTIYLKTEERSIDNLIH